MPVVGFPGSNEPKSGLLADPNLDPTVRLELVLNQLQRARAEWEAECAAADQVETAEADPRQVTHARHVVREAYERWSALAEQADGLANALRRARPDNNQYQQLYRATLDNLKDQFADGGPHYDLLCERTAALTVRLRRMEASSREYPAADHARLNAQLLAYINQLQKYTEAMKSETLSKEAQGVAEKLLMVVEKNLAPSYPELWSSVMRDIRQALESAA